MIFRLRLTRTRYASTTCCGHRSLPMPASRRSQISGFFKLSYWSSVSVKAELDKSNTTCRISSTAYSSTSFGGAIAKVSGHQHRKKPRMISKMTGGHGAKQSKRRGMYSSTEPSRHLAQSAQAGVPMLHVGYATRSAFLPVALHVRFRTPVQHALRSVHLGGRLSRDMASVATEAANDPIVPIVSENVSSPRCCDYPQEPECVVPVVASTWPDVCSMGYATARPDIAGRH